MRKRLLPFLTIPIGLSAWLVGTTAHAATCTVPAESDPVLAGDLLRDCVDDVNAGFYSAIDFAVSQAHAVESPLFLERDVIIFGADQTLEPTSGFGGGDSLIVVGAGGANVTAHIDGLKFQSSGAVMVRAVRVGEEHIALLDGVSILGFTLSPGNGGGVLGEPGSKVIITGSHLAANRADSGGAIYVQGGELAIKNSVINSNDADYGAGIATASAAELSLLNSRVLFNQATVDGGGVHVGPGAKAVTVDGTELEFNEAEDDGGAFFGGGFLRNCTFRWNYAHDRGGGAVLGPKSFVLDSTFFENEAYRGGGLAVLFDGSHDMGVDGTTFEGNHADRHASNQGQPTGGGVYVNRTSGVTPGTFILDNSTFTGNSSLGAVATYGGAIGVAMVPARVTHVTFFDNDAVFGGAIHSSSATGTDLTLLSSIVAGSPTDACLINSSFTEDTSLDDDGSCGVTYSSIDPLLAPLADNGGPTETHLPNATEVMGTATCYASVDQRGVARPSSGCDIGSVEQ